MMKTYVKKICKMLDVQPPKVRYVQELDTPTKMAAYSPEKKTLYVKDSSENYDLLFAIAHELRHLWQSYNRKEMFDEYQSSSGLSIEEYNLQEAEVDANAFGMIVMSELFHVTPLFDGQTEEVKQAIQNRAKEISAD
ncbi:MAG: hypothetical protein K6E92_09075 [Lachnospiraceae bacterium]|nr:hypothetical protein [Lachnospiraceae bacterium]